MVFDFVDDVSLDVEGSCLERRATRGGVAMMGGLLAVVEVRRWEPVPRCGFLGSGIIIGRTGFQLLGVSSFPISGCEIK